MKKAKPHNILFISPKDQVFFHQTLIPATKTHFPQVHFFVTEAFKSAQYKISQIHFATVIIQSISPIDHQMDFLIYLKKNNPHTNCIISAEKLKRSQIINYVNKTNVLGIFNHKWDLKRIFILIRKSIDKYILKNRRIQLVEEISQINRDLEKTTKYLAKEAEDRTQHIKASQLDAQKKKYEAERLVHLVQKLGATTDYEEYLITLKNEHKRWHRVIAPFLIIYSKNQATLYFLEGRTMKKRNLSQTLQIETSIEENHLRKTLASILKKPFGQILKMDFGNNRWLCFEHILQAQELIDFKKYIHLNKQGLESSFQRIFQDRQLSTTAKVWQKTFDVISDPIAIIDDSDKILRSNHCFFLLTLDDKDIPQKLKNSVLSDELTYQMQINKRLFEVSCFYVDVRSSSTRFHQHKVYFLRDITTSKTLYSHKVQQEKMIALGHLAGNITHELNNPLTGLRALAQVIMTELDPASHLYKDIMEIENALNRSQKVIENFLEFTLSDTTIKTQSVELDDLVNKTLPLLKTVTKFHKLHLELHSKGSYVKVSPQLIQQVIFNLIHNACQAVLEDGDVSIATDVIDTVYGEYVELKISDNGPGIPDQIKDQIFLPFVTTKDKEKGTGLGLYLCRNIVQKYKGKIFYDKEFQQGTQFVVRLPKV